MELFKIKVNGEWVEVPAIRGMTGDQGPTGATGETGAIGPTGAPGESIIGPTGPQGEPGQNGQDGAQGPTGAQGEPGQNGQDGAMGPTGETGAQGPTGAPGAQGPTGASADLEMPVEITQGSDTMLTLTTRDGYPTFIVKDVSGRYVVRFFGDNEQEFGSFNTPDGWVGNAQLNGTSHYDYSYTASESDKRLIANIQTVENFINGNVLNCGDTPGTYSLQCSVTHTPVNWSIPDLTIEWEGNDLQSVGIEPFNYFSAGQTYTTTLSYNNGSTYSDTFTVPADWDERTDFHITFTNDSDQLHWADIRGGSIFIHCNDNQAIQSVESVVITGMKIGKTYGWQSIS